MGSRNGTTPYPLEQLRSKDFPPLLREIPDAPRCLYLRGSLPKKECVYLCVVGSRACSVYGRRMTHSLIAGLARHPVAIVSGMALGTDTEAHRAALDVGLPTVAVLPSSCDDASLYPASNKALAQRILASGGALISEERGPHKAALWDFARRNRIMAGMSRATLIVEAGEKSGTLITVRLALDYNREVLGVPHELGRESGAGVNRILREGATLVRDSADILQALGLAQPPHTEPLPLPRDLTPSERAALEALGEPLERDELIEHSGLSAQEANIALSSLLIRGLVVERLGKVERAQ
jgi:DNA processing protein